MTARRELQLAVLLCLLGSALVLFALHQTWFSVADIGLTITAVRTSVPGTRIVEGGSALGLVALAGVVALAATKRWGRVLVGVLVLGAGLGISLGVLWALRDGIEVRGLQRLPAGGADRQATLVWPWVALLGGVLLILSGLFVAVRGPRWAALSGSYEAPGVPVDRSPVGDKAVWEALDRGEDPTSS